MGEAARCGSPDAILELRSEDGGRAIGGVSRMIEVRLANEDGDRIVLDSGCELLRDFEYGTGPKRPPS